MSKHIKYVGEDQRVVIEYIDDLWLSGYTVTFQRKSKFLFFTNWDYSFSCNVPGREGEEDLDELYEKALKFHNDLCDTKKENSIKGWEKV